jgi:hypothetical protein
MSDIQPLGFHEYRHYSIEHDCEMARVWMFDKRGAEFFQLIPVDLWLNGKRVSYRERRQAAVETIYEAIMAGYEPGEVRIT